MPDPDSFPLGATVRLADLDVDPYPLLARLRANEPVTWVPETGMWFVTRRDDIISILRDAARFTTDAESSTIRDIFGAHMMTTDGEVALRYKRACLHAFRADTLVREMADWVGDWVDARLTELDRKANFDLMSEIATPLAVDSALRVLGLPLDLADRIETWYEDFAAALANFTDDDAVRARGKAAARAFDGAVRPRLTTLGEGGDGLLGQLANRLNDRLTDDEIISNALIILFGGIETTASMIGNTVWSVLENDRWSWMVADLSRVERLIDESLRWQPAVQSITRHTVVDCEISGVPVAAGSVVQCMIGGANRDPNHFVDPDGFDPDRGNAADHLAFGTGRHLCLGAHLARMEIGAVLGGLAATHPQLSFVGRRAPELRGYEFRRPTKLWIEGA